MGGNSLTWVLLALGGASAVLTFNAYWPIRRSLVLGLTSFVAGWLTCELAAHHIVVQLAAALALIAHGGLAHWSGMLGLMLLVGSWAGLVRLHRRGQLAQGATESALASLEGEDGFERMPAPAVTLRDVWMPFWHKRRDVVRVPDQVYARVGRTKLRAEVFHHEAMRPGAPVLLFVHGGGWVVRFRKLQALPMLHRLASEGWVCVSVDYRLSPFVRFPEHLIDVKRALAWTRENAHRWGGDASFLAISGNSAGGHLAALAALTWDRKELQPGFEEADTRVQAAVTLYGVYDWTDRHGHWPHRGIRHYLRLVVMGRRFRGARDHYELASPIGHVRKDAPPWFLVHGDRDSLVPVDESRRFADALGDISESPVVYSEVPDAQHAFEIFRSIRGLHTVHGVSVFLRTVVERARRKRLRPPPEVTPAAPEKGSPDVMSPDVMSPGALPQR